MGLFGSLRLGSKSLARIGNPQIQPVRTHSTPARSLALRAPTVSGRGSPRAADVPLLRMTGLHIGSSRARPDLRSKIERLRNPSVSRVATDLALRKNFLIPSFNSRYSTIRPAYKSLVKPKNVYRVDSSDDAAPATGKFQPYEKISGISHERPEVVLLSEFKPLFTSEISRFQQYPYYDQLVDSGHRPFMSDAGNYVDAQINSRNLRCVNVIHMFRSLRRRNFHFQNVYRTRRSGVHNSLKDLNTTVWFLINVVRSIDRLKGQLDLRDDIHVVDPQAVIAKMSNTFTRARASWLFNFLQRNATKYLPDKYDITDVLERLGYKKENTKELFSSSKLWLQMLEEYKDILRHHSAEFLDIDPVSQKRDTNATVLNKKDSKTFNLNSSDPKDLPFLNEIVGFSPRNIRNATNSVTKGFSTIYDRSTTFKSEEARIAALASIVSKEFAYSRGLAIPSVRRALSEKYDYTVNDGPTSRSTGTRSRSSRIGNLDVFDNVIGTFTKNVIDIPAIGTNSLASLAQERPTSEIAVLPFESKYLEGELGTITPGSAYYVDEVLNLKNLTTTVNSLVGRGGRSIATTTGPVFNVKRLEDLAVKLERSNHSFATIVDGMNLYGVTEFDTTERAFQNPSALMGNSSAFLEKIIVQFVDNKGRTLPFVRSDRLTSIFALARKNKLLRAQLFLFYMNRIARSYSADSSRSVTAPIIGDNTPFTDEMVKNILSTLFRTTKPSRLLFSVRQRNIRLVTKGDSNDLTNSVLESSLRAGTTLSRRIESLMKSILDEFNSDNAISSANDRTLFGGHMDTTIMMVVFDMIISAVSRYGNQAITGRNISGFRSIRGGRTTTYFVTQRDTNYRSAVNDAVNRMKKEQALVQQITWCVLNSVGRLSQAIVGFTNYMNSTQSIIRLRALSDVIDDDEELRQLMTEQQIMGLGSTAFDITEKLLSRGRRSIATFGADADQDGDFDSDDEISILDDSPISPVLRDALYGFFGQPGLAGEKAINKKILTVGLPLGFATKLNQKVRIAKQKKTSFVQKQNDIIEISVYKLDLLNQDLVFRPQKFLFELSRFPVRNDQHFKPLPDNPTFDDIAAAIPTRDFEESFEEGNSSVAYWRPAGDGDTNTRISLDADSYGFLEEEEKEDIIENHLTSYMCEIYLKLLTGISTGEHNFDLELESEKEDVRPVEQDFVKMITTHKMDNISRFIRFNKKSLSRRITGLKRSIRLPKRSTRVPSPGVLFGSSVRKALSSFSGISSRHNMMSSPRLSSFSGLPGRLRSSSRAGTSNPSRNTGRKKSTAELERATLKLSASMASMSHRKMYSAVHALRNISHFTRMKTSLSSGLNMQKNIIRPKKFDRVFNLMIDPDDFEIDYDKTMETEFGRESFKQLIKRGDVLPDDRDTLTKSVGRRGRLRGAARNFRRKSRQRAARAELAKIDPDNFFVRERDKGEGDVSFEKYFVVINTFGEESV